MKECLNRLDFDKAIEVSAGEYAAFDETVPVKSYIESFVEWFGATPVVDELIDKSPSPSLLKSIVDFLKNDAEVVQDNNVLDDVADLSDSTVSEIDSSDTLGAIRPAALAGFFSVSCITACSAV